MATEQPDYRYPATWNNLVSNDNHPGFNPAPLFTDEEFYGKWDGTQWTTPGLFDYAGRPGLAAVGVCVKRGDYAAADGALLKYFREREGLILPDLPEANPRTMMAAELFMDRFYMETPIVPLCRFEVGREAREFTLDVTDRAQHGEVGFMLYSRHKGEGAAYFSSRESGDHPPQLRLKINGQTRTLDAVADTYLRYSDKGKGKEPLLRVSGSKMGVILDENSCEALIRFSLEGLNPSDIEQADLVIHGYTDAATGTKAVLLCPDSISPLDPTNEATLGWDDAVHKLGSYEGVEGGAAWRNPPQGGLFMWFFVTAIVRFPHYPHVIAAYLDTHDERYAQRAIQIYLDYFENQMFNRLDDGSRVDNLIRPSMALYKSPSMTPRALKIMLEHAWRLGDWFYDKGKWFHNHNYGSSFIAGSAGIAYQFPEFRDTPRWWAKNHERALLYTTKGDFSADHSFSEANTAYGCMVMRFLNNYRSLAVASKAELPPELVKSFRGIGRYTMDVTDPSGVLFPYGDTSKPHAYDPDIIRGIATDHHDDELLYIITHGQQGTPPTRTSVWYPDTKIGIMRTAWADQNALALFVNARQGGTHWKASVLSLCAYAYGQQLIDDTYNYPGHTPHPSDATSNHNTIEIDGKPQSPGAASDGGLVTNPGFDHFAGFTEAYAGFRHQRDILLLKPAKFWVVSDRVQNKTDTQGTHRFTQTWHPRPGSRITLNEQTKIAQTDFPEKANIQIIPADPGQLTAQLPEGWWSNQTHTYAAFEKTGADGATFDTVLYPVPAGQSAKVNVTRLDIGEPTGVATALKIDIDNPRGQQTGWYYLSHEQSPTTRVASQFTTDARLFYLQTHRDGTVQSLSVEKASVVRDHQQTLFAASKTLDDIHIEWDADTKVIRVQTAARDLSADLTLFAPFDVTQVTHNGSPTAYTADPATRCIQITAPKPHDHPTP